MRAIHLAAISFLAIGSLSQFMGRADEPVGPKADPWVGEYLKFCEFDTKREGRDGKAQRVTISKGAEGYTLSGPYAFRTFKEVNKGVLSDGQGGLGRIYAGSAEFSDGKRVRVLRAEFCYEDFVLYGESAAPDKSSGSTKKK